MTDESILDGETARISFDARGNHLIVHPNHDPTEGDIEMDDDYEEPIVEELD